MLLEPLLTWMQGALLDPAPLPSVLRKKKQAALIKPGQVEQVLQGPNGLSGADGLEIYRRMYLARFEEVLAMDHGALSAALGPEGWEALVAAYLARHPSTSWTLARAGDALPKFVAGWAHRLRKPKWVPELARLEHAVLLSSEAAGGPQLSPTQLAQIAPEAWPSARMHLDSSVILDTYDTSVASTWRHFEDHGVFQRPRRKRERVVVYRRGSAPDVLLLTAVAHRFLTTLASQPLAEALVVAFPRPRAEHGALLQGWLSDWTARGIFSGVSV